MKLGRLICISLLALEIATGSSVCKSLPDYTDQNLEQLWGSILVKPAKHVAVFGLVRQGLLSSSDAKNPVTVVAKLESFPSPDSSDSMLRNRSIVQHAAYLLLDLYRQFVRCEREIRSDDIDMKGLLSPETKLQFDESREYELQMMITSAERRLHRAQGRMSTLKAKLVDMADADSVAEIEKRLHPNVEQESSSKLLLTK